MNKELGAGLREGKVQASHFSWVSVVIKPLLNIKICIL